MNLEETIEFLTETKKVSVQEIHKRLGITAAQYYSKQKTQGSEKREKFARQIRAAFPEHFEIENMEDVMEIEQKYIKLLELNLEELREEKARLLEVIEKQAEEIKALINQLK